MTQVRVFLVILMGLSALGCRRVRNMQESLEGPPPLTPTQNPQHFYAPVTTPVPHHKTGVYGDNSLWRVGARTFFKDQRASQEGDILTVLMNTDDRADLQNNSRLGQTSKFHAPLPNILGYEKSLKKVLPSALDPKNALNISRDSKHDMNTGSIRRQEKIRLRIAAMVMQVLPHGVLSIKGRQEVRVNGELRLLEVTGFVRPEDISAANTIDGERIAEARVIYGGRGSMTNRQDPPIMQEFLHNVWPF